MKMLGSTLLGFHPVTNIFLKRFRFQVTVADTGRYASAGRMSREWGGHVYQLLVLEKDPAYGWKMAIAVLSGVIILLLLLIVLRCIVEKKRSEKRSDLRGAVTQNLIRQ